MTSIIFENPGQLDLTAVSTFGISVKEGENPIGFFGTGMKYALAILLREGQEVHVQDGHGLGDKPLGFTTHLGANWLPWMAYRELRCNSIDEKGKVFRALRVPEAQIGTVRFIVTGELLSKIHDERHIWFLDQEVPPNETLTITNKPSAKLFYRGICVLDLPKPALFTYNINTKMDLTEDRTAADQYLAFAYIGQAWTQCKDKALIKQAVTTRNDTFESVIDYNWSYPKPSPEFLETIGELVKDRGAIIVPSALASWFRYAKGQFEPQAHTLTKVQSKMLSKAIAFCQNIGVPVDNYPIEIAETLGPGVLGLARDQKIFLAEETFNLGGTKQVASTLIEEYIHLKYGYADLTRQLQSWLFDKIVSLGEEIQGEPL